MTIATSDDDDFEEDKDAFDDDEDDDVAGDEKDYEKYMEQQRKMFETLDEGTKKEAENVADGVFGALGDTLSKPKKGADNIDIAVNKVLLNLLEKARQSIMTGVAQNKINKGFKRASTVAQKKDQDELDAMVESGEIHSQFAFMAQMKVKQLEALMVGLIPIVKLDTGKYLIGSEIKSMQIKNDSLLVRVGGGYCSLDVHI